MTHLLADAYHAPGTSVVLSLEMSLRTNFESVALALKVKSLCPLLT